MMLVSIYWILILLSIIFGSFGFLRMNSGLVNVDRGQSNCYHQEVNTKIALTRLNGIPRLFRWLVDKYPSVVKSANVIDQLRIKESLDLLPRDEKGNYLVSSSDSPTRVDNFYLDMNGIIHACTHANTEGLVPLNEKDMFRSIFAYTDSLFKFIRPRNKMYLAVDGVAPRAKRNQQRARRFRSSKDRQDLILAFMEKEGRAPTATEAFDSNCITPGTPFMGRLCHSFRAWLAHKRGVDPFYKENNATIIFSGSDVPGEGEHKVMTMIREDQLLEKQQREQRRHNSAGSHGQGLTHCLYGLDADLIMLSLVTHEPHFILLREKIVYRKHTNTGARSKRKAPAVKQSKIFKSSNFEILDIAMVRSMLRQYFEPVNQVFSGIGYRKNGQIVLKDPSIRFMGIDGPSGSGPSVAALQHRKGRKKSPTFIHPMWLSNSRIPGNKTPITGVNYISPSSAGYNDKNMSPWSRAGHTSVHSHETSGEDINFENGIYDFERIVDDFVFLSFFVGNDFIPSIPHIDIADGCMHMIMNVYQKLLPRLGGYITNKTSVHLPRLELIVAEFARREPLYFEQRSVEDYTPEYASDEYKEHYYMSKFNMDYTNKTEIRRIVRCYIESLFWVLEYYHGGCCSWSWYYPYLYAPLASDLRDLGGLSIGFDSGAPASPLVQLISVLPPQSGNLLPKAYEEAIKNPNSPLHQYFPIDFEVDASGKKADWEGVVKIPFIDETVLLSTLESIDKSQSGAQLERQDMINRLGTDHVYGPE